jgi:hypothetical protein
MPEGWPDRCENKPSSRRPLMLQPFGRFRPLWRRFRPFRQRFRPLRWFWCSPLRLRPPARLCPSHSPARLHSPLSTPRRRRSPLSAQGRRAPLPTACLFRGCPNLCLRWWVCVVTPSRARDRKSILVAALPLVPRLVEKVVGSLAPSPRREQAIWRGEAGLADRSAGSWVRRDRSPPALALTAENRKGVSRGETPFLTHPGSLQ